MSLNYKAIETVLSCNFPGLVRRDWLETSLPWHNTRVWTRIQILKLLPTPINNLERERKENWRVFFRVLLRSEELAKWLGASACKLFWIHLKPTSRQNLINGAELVYKCTIGNEWEDETRWTKCAFSEKKKERKKERKKKAPAENAAAAAAAAAGARNECNQLMASADRCPEGGLSGCGSVNRHSRRRVPGSHGCGYASLPHFRPLSNILSSFVPAVIICGLVSFLAPSDGLAMSRGRW